MSAIADRAGVSLRHLSGKHDQKSHAGGRGSISTEAMQERVAEITAEFGGRAAAERERGALEDAAVFDLAGYSGTPTVLSPSEFDAFDGVEVPYGPGQAGRSEFARGFRSNTDFNGGKAARDMVYDDNYFVGRGVFTNGLYVGDPSTANFFSQIKPPGYDDVGDPGGILDLMSTHAQGPPAPRHSVDNGVSGYVRVKLKPGTKVVDWEDLDRVTYDGVTMPKSRPSHEIVREAISEHGAQVINTSSGADTLRGMVVLDRSAMVVEGFVPLRDAYTEGADVSLATQGTRARVPTGEWTPDRSRAASLLVNESPEIRPVLIDQGWAGLTAEQVARAAELFAGFYDASLRHLAGKHDQKSHAGGRGGSKVGTVDDGMPEGWEVTEPGQYGEAVRAKKGSVTVSVRLDAYEYTGLGPDGDGHHNSPEEQQMLAERAATAVARSVDPLIAAYPDEFSGSTSVMVDVYHRGDPRGDIRSDSTAGTTRKALNGQQSIINLRSDLFAPGRGDSSGGSLVTSYSDGGVMGRNAIGKMARSMQDSAGPRGRNGFHGEAYFVDPVRATVVHEMGHAFDTIRSGDVTDTGTSKSSDPGFPKSQADWSASRQAGYDMTHVTTDTGAVHHQSSNQGWETYETTSGYGQTNPAEMYAEGFAEWHMRDVVEPSASARFLAGHEGWEGA